MTPPCILCCNLSPRFLKIKRKRIQVAGCLQYLHPELQDARRTCAAQCDVSLSLQRSSFRRRWPRREDEAGGTQELAGSQVAKRSAPDSQLGQMAAWRHDGTNERKRQRQNTAYPCLSVPFGATRQSQCFTRIKDSLWNL